MSNAVVIVESPAKAKTIEGYLGKGYKVLASYGHVRDIPSRENAVEPDNDFAMHYEVDTKAAKVLKDIMAALKDADTLYLATDLDREGEAISWHVWEEIKRRNPKLAASLHVHRIEFTEITKSAIQQAIREPRSLALNLINAQQARRALDYLVGFTLSPVLWRKVKGGLSAGRVQSVALRLIAEREDAIEAFKAEEFWTIHGHFTAAGGKPLPSTLAVYNGQKVEKFSFTTEKDAHAALAQLKPHTYSVYALEKSDKRRYPSPPFITSTLQQEAARKLGFAARRTMQTAQRLYEAGHITYMRTDSLNLAQEALTKLRGTIAQRYGNEYLPAQPNFYKSKSKNAQEAHEAIRPTDSAHTPDMMRLEEDQRRLYQLIWQRTVASQMTPARLEQTTITLNSEDAKHTFKATGSVIIFPGFLTVYQEGRDDEADDGETLLPQVKEGERVATREIAPEQHFTQPPPRFTEATLVKALEEYGIGRPSTYASIISTLQDRGYVRLDQKRFFPEDVGRIVAKFLTEHFGQYVDYNFTANLEDDLDAIARGEHDWKPTLRAFWGPFKALTVEKNETVKKSDVTTEATGETCPQCGKGELIWRLGKYGRFKGCNNYPECKYIEKTGPAATPGQDTGIACPECLAAKPQRHGTLLKRTSRMGKIFYGCSAYPDCKYAVWDEPVQTPCPKCAWPFISKKVSKKYGEWHRCPNCDWNDNPDAAEATAKFRERFQAARDKRTAGKAAAAARAKAEKAEAKAAAKATAKPKATAKKPAAKKKAPAKK
ncbi:MAG: type I DNA topoisomerase [Proteobacteria bacterium]|nr:type I DNA topoisomerase [Pseudomonadota bacterium]